MGTSVTKFPIAEYALNIDGEFAAGEWRRIASSDAVLLHCRS
jgi:hypothetical protein